MYTRLFVRVTINKDAYRRVIIKDPYTRVIIIHADIKLWNINKAHFAFKDNNQTMKDAC